MFKRRINIGATTKQLFEALSRQFLVGAVKAGYSFLDLINKSILQRAK